MVDTKLVYFNLRGKAEIVRWVLAVAGVEYEDYRMKPGEWTKLKPGSPMGQVPTMTINGQEYCQSMAMARYYAVTNGLGGDTLDEQTRADMIVDCCRDMADPVGKAFHEQDPTKKQEMFDTYKRETLPKFMAMFEELLKQNNGGDCYFVGTKLTWADLAFLLHTTSFIEYFIGTFEGWNNFPKLKALKERVEQTPELVKWFKERPESKF